MTGIRILLVDDHPVVRAGLRAMLSDFEGTTVAAEAGDGAAALAQLSRLRALGEPVDVVLMDLRLPDMDGTDAARMLAQQARTASIPVVALTSVTLEDDPGWLRTAGFAGYLEKPIDVERFPDQVRRYCC